MKLFIKDTVKTGIIVFVILLCGAQFCFGASTSCTFNTTTSTLAFPAIDPSSIVNATASAVIGIACTGNPTQPAAIYQTGTTPCGQVASGLHDIGAQHRLYKSTAPAYYMNYSVSISPVSANKNTTSITVSGTINGVDFQNAYSGPYSDTLTIAVCP